LTVSELAVATEPSLSEAEALLDKVLQRRPGLGPVYFYPSVLQAFRGQPQLALKSVEHCFAINPSSAHGYAHMAQFWLDRVDEALDRIGDAIRLSPKVHPSDVRAKLDGEVRISPCRSRQPSLSGQCCGACGVGVTSALHLQSLSHWPEL
jgi:tetratricopeptide (TPR) repeat protein